MNYNELHGSPRDGDLRFDPITHTYTHIGRIEPLTSVTAFIGSFFDPYDPYFWIKRDQSLSPAERELRMREQDAKGFIARNLGTFLHTQIECTFLGKPTECNIRLQSEEEEIDKMCDIETELKYFREFQRDHQLEPYRTEWMIYDDHHWLAGTLDLLVHESDGTFTLYDWKRSQRMGREQGDYFNPNRSNFRQKGHGVISHLDDTPFIHAALQQNMYRSILKKNYGIEIGQMYLVILSPAFSRYHKVEVPNYEHEIEMMLDLY